MKFAITAVLCSAASAAILPAPNSNLLLPWKEADIYTVMQKNPLEMYTLPEAISGTWLYCQGFNNPSGSRPDGPYKDAQDCLDKHEKKPWLQPDPAFGPCDKRSHYIEEACGTDVYCKQHDVQDDLPVPALFDNSAECFNFYSQPPVSKA
ncbi:hypothetical protein NOR_05770 [Metarhizium rileyi]|uniref:Uncharacterized protein n=1 Tax=Metarhizium rileyi (strain RCEF 4871) TaxID=1649241 RepID=A0A167C1W4_METRR|nr:hypothetical protein NOR_05770 [Metarhizium rileyi RCEF 4871]